MDYELTLFDRIEVINTAYEKYDLEHNAYISFSGGKDSTVLHYLMDEAVPNNRIPRVFINTGIEYNSIIKFVKHMAEKDDRFVIVAPSKPIKQILEKDGYPFKSKEHSTKLHLFQIGHKNTRSLTKYLSNGRFSCPKCLKYQFNDDFKMKISSFCCNRLKKEPAKKWGKENNRSIVITGMRKEEGGERTNLKCILTSKKGKVKKFHPLAVVDEAFEDEYVLKNSVAQVSIFYANSIIHHLTLSVQVVKVAHSHLT